MRFPLYGLGSSVWLSVLTPEEWEQGLLPAKVCDMQLLSTQIKEVFYSAFQYLRV